MGQLRTCYKVVLRFVGDSSRICPGINQWQRSLLLYIQTCNILGPQLQISKNIEIFKTVTEIQKSMLWFSKQ